MITYLYEHILPAAYEILPKAMNSPEASAMLLAIALQETHCAARRQFGNGPARGFWQFERGGGVAGVQTHPLTSRLALLAHAALCYGPQMTAGDAWTAIEHNDVLAAVYSRLLLWTHHSALPGPSLPDVAWVIYFESWRPGKPKPETWAANYKRAWAIVQPSPAIPA